MSDAGVRVLVVEGVAHEGPGGRVVFGSTTGELAGDGRAEG